MPKLKLLFITGLLLTLAVHAARGDSYTFDLIPPDGNISGPPGSTIGWGYSLTNSSAADWLVTTGVNSDPFLNGTPSVVFDFPVLDPGTSVSEVFDLMVPSGLFELTWDLPAPNGFVNAGQFTLTAQWWSGDPLNGGAFLMDALDASRSYSATVSSIPEPSTISLLASTLIAFAMSKRLLEHLGENPNVPPPFGSWPSPCHERRIGTQDCKWS